MTFAASLSRATQRILARSGEDALLRGLPTLHKVHIARDVEMIDAQGNMVVQKHVATISSEDAPVRGDSLVVGSETFAVETPVDDNGYTVRVILRKVA